MRYLKEGSSELLQRCCSADVSRSTKGQEGWEENRALNSAAVLGKLPEQGRAAQLSDTDRKPKEPGEVHSFSAVSMQHPLTLQPLQLSNADRAVLFWHLQGGPGRVYLELRDRDLMKDRADSYPMNPVAKPLHITIIGHLWDNKG